MLQESIGPAAAATAHGAKFTKNEKQKPCTRLATLTQADADLIGSLNAARDKLNAHVALLNRALDLRELLYFGIDLDDAVQAVADFRRDCARVRS